jgi:hypothetical protein
LGLKESEALLHFALRMGRCRRGLKESVYANQSSLDQRESWARLSRPEILCWTQIWMGAYLHTFWVSMKGLLVAGADE